MANSPTSLRDTKAQQILADKVHFYLSPKKWDEFCAALDAPPKNLPGLRKLLTEPSVFK